MQTEEFIRKYKCEYISSRTNPKTVLLGKLNDKKYRDREQIFLADGVKLAEEAARYAKPVYLAVAESAVEKVCHTAELYSKAGIQLFMLSDNAFEKVSPEKSPEGVIAALAYMNELHLKDDISKFDDWQNNKRLLMLDGIRDPGNLGTILRSAEAMGINGVILSDCADIYNRKTVRAAMGALFRLPLYISQNGLEAVRAMKRLGRRVIGAALGEHSLTLGNYEIHLTDCPVIGNEGHGLSEEFIGECTASLMIPMAGNTESLNAAQAAICIMWEYRRAYLKEPLI